MITIRELTLKDNEVWDRFIESSNNGTIFHKMSFLSYHEKNKFNFLFLGFYEDGNLIAEITGEIKNNIFISPVGASYGSFAIKNLSYFQTEKIIDSFLNYCKEKKIANIVLTPPPIFYQREINQQLEFFFIKKGFLIDRALLTSVANLLSFDDDVLKSFDKKRRNQIRKATRESIIVEQSNALETFYPILLENKKKFKILPTHALDDLKKLKNTNTNNIKLFLALKDRKPIAGVLVFVCNTNTALIFYIAQKSDFEKFQPVSLLIYNVISWVKKSNYRYLDFGVNTDTSSQNPMDQVKSLIDFKESFNSRGFLRTTYRKIL